MSLGAAGCGVVYVEYAVLTMDFRSPKLDGSVKITSNNQQDPNAYLTCIQMGKFQPSSCNLNGPLSGGKAPIVIPTTVVPAA